MADGVFSSDPYELLSLLEFGVRGLTLYWLSCTGRFGYDTQNESPGKECGPQALVGFIYQPI